MIILYEINGIEIYKKYCNIFKIKFDREIYDLSI
jgi:hypothetical protein